MKHDTAIPIELHAGAGASVKEALGSFWSIVFKDQDLVDATVFARVMSACQAYIDLMESLSLRDHSGIPVFHREHWHPLLVRLSERNTGCGLKVGMDGSPKIGAQGAGSIFREGEVFVVGGNAEFSKVDTYPIDAACRLVSVGTCICDAISRPEHVLVSGRDFELRDNVLVIRKEHDPFTAGGYRVFEDGADRIAVLWLCDAEFDREHVGDFLAYPMGFDVKSTPDAARMLSAMWDVVIYGLTPQHMDILLGALFGVPVVKAGTTVERIIEADDVDTIVTSDGVYRVPHGMEAECVVTGASIPAGTFLTDEVKVYHGLSQDEFEALVADGRISSLTLPPGSVAGVSVPVTVANVESQLEDASGGRGKWFKLNSGDSEDSPFWAAVFARTAPDELTALCTGLAEAGTVNPLLRLGYAVLSNTVLVYTDRDPIPGVCAPYALDVLRRLMPAYGSVQIIKSAPVAGASFGTFAAMSVPENDSSTVGMCDEVELEVVASATASSEMEAASDDVALRFIPDAATEV